MTESYDMVQYEVSSEINSDTNFRAANFIFLVSVFLL